MAEEPGQAKSAHELRQEIAHSRDRLARDLSGLRYELNFPLKIRKSVQRNTAAWIAGAATLGGLFSIMPARTRKVQVKARGRSESKKKGEEQKKGIVGAGLALGLLRFAATLAKPAVVSFVSRKMKGTPAAAPTRRM